MLPSVLVSTVDHSQSMQLHSDEHSSVNSVTITTNRRLKVLMVASACHPDKGSEPGIGWGWVEALSTHHDLCVIAGEQECNRQAIERRLANDPQLRHNVRFHFLPRDEWTPLCDWFPPLYYRRHRQWQLQAFALAQRLAQEQRFDLCHQLTMAGFREPGYLWKLNLPFVWGPVGGTANVPLRLARDLSFKDICYHLAKIALNEAQLRFHPRVTRALRKTSLLLTTTSDTQAKFARVRGVNSIMIGQTGITPTDEPALSLVQRAPDQPLRIGWSGLHVSRKALPILLHALALLPPDCRWELEIAGQGPLTDAWQRLARSLGLGDRCRWHGWMSKAQAVEIMRRCHVFAFPSLHEGVPTVVMEALSCGIPVVCLDHCGMADVVTAACGIKIPLARPSEVYRAFADALLKLWRNEDQRRIMGRQGIARSRQLTYANKACVLSELYHQTLREMHRA